MVGYSLPTKNLAAIRFSPFPAGLCRGSSLEMRRASLTLRTNGLPLLKLFLQARFQSRCSAIDTRSQVPDEPSEIIFIGTGTSEGIPRVSFLTDPLKTCPVCSKAVEANNKNRRLNTSILVRYSNSSGNKNILIDVGKKQSMAYVIRPAPGSETYLGDAIFLIWKGSLTRFFYHSALRWFPQFGLRRIDAVIITHSHADAIGAVSSWRVFWWTFDMGLVRVCAGLDDLRDWTNNVQSSIPIYVAKRDFEVMKKTHYYLVDKSVIIPGAVVSELQFNIINEEPFIVHNLKVTPLPVWHGKGYRSLGFRFGNICYISDVSEIPEETYLLLKDCEILILDALRPDRSSATHFGLPRALEEVRKIRPRRTLFTGMTHLMDHDKVNEDLAKLIETEGLDVQLSHDGLRVPVKL